jgi:hypothetical protein
MEPDELVDRSPRKKTVLQGVGLTLAIVYVFVSLYLVFATRNELATLAKSQQATVQNLNQQLNATNLDLKTSTDALAQRLGMTQQDIQASMATRAAQLRRQQRAAEKRLSEQQKSSIGEVTGEVAGVKTDLGSTQTDLAATKTDLESTKAKLESTIGDLGVQSGLIAHTRNDLEDLKHRGDRNYYEFTLLKGAHATPVSQVSLALKKTDPKRSKFTLNVIADDRTIEKKDRTVAEPMQFYTGRNHALYEVVIFSVDKNKITGYLSTPKNTPEAMMTQ